MTNLLLQHSLEVDPTGYWYQLFYQLAVFAAFLVFLTYGYFKKYPLNKWLLLSVTATFCAVIGSKLGTYGIAEWQLVWESGALLPNTNRSSVGAYVLGLSGIFLSIRLLRLPRASFDVYAYLIPVVIIFQRVGCLLGACCFGTPTNGNWGIQYNGISLIRDHHINSGLVSKYEMSSCMVHPVPVYFTVGGLLALLIVFKVRHLMKKEGNLALLSIGIILLGRFFIEFFRDAITNHQMGDVYAGLKGVQWFLLVAAAVFFATVFFRERSLVQNVSESELRPNSLIPSVCYATIIALLILVSKSVFTPMEIGIMHAKLILVWITLAYFLLTQIQFRSIRWQAIAMALLSFSMMSQTNPKGEEDLTGRKDISVTAGFTELNKDVVDLNCVLMEEGCSGSYCAQYDSSFYNLGYVAGKVGFDVIDYYSYSDSKWNKYTRYGVELQPEFFLNETSGASERKFTVMPYWGVGNTKIFESRIGLRIGSLYAEDFLRSDKIRRTQLTFNQRLGNLNCVYVNFGINNAPDLGASVNRFHFSANYNLTKVNSGPLDHISIGTSSFFKSSRESSSTLYLETRFLFNEHWTFSPRFGVFDLPTGDDTKAQFYYGIRAGYRFRTEGKEE